VTFTTTVSGAGGPPTGTVTFYDNGISLGTGTLSGGSASLATTAVAAGTRSITATYNGNSQFASSTSGALTQTVNKATATSSLTLSPATQQYTDNETFEVTVSNASGDAPAAGVNFKIGTQTMNTSGVVPFVYQGAGVWKATLTQQLIETVTGQLNPNGAVKIVSATLSGISANYTLGNPASKSMLIGKEDATVAYNGPANVVTAPAGGSIAIIALSATVSDIADGATGNVGKATVTFYNRDTNTPIATVAVTPNSDPASGIATYNWSVDIGTATSKIYNVGFVVGSYYNRNNAADNRPVTVTK
jgi:hypothetical protein